MEDHGGVKELLLVEFNNKVKKVNKEKVKVKEKVNPLNKTF